MDVHGRKHNHEPNEHPEAKVPKRIASQHAAMVELAMLGGERGRAHEVVDLAFVLAKREQGTITTTSRLDQVLPNRYATILYNEGINTVGELVQMAPHDLVKLEQLRWRSVEIISEALAKHGFRLGTREQP